MGVVFHDKCPFFFQAICLLGGVSTPAIVRSAKEQCANSVKTTGSFSSEVTAWARQQKPRKEFIVTVFIEPCALYVEELEAWNEAR